MNKEVFLKDHILQLLIEPASIKRIISLAKHHINIYKTASFRVIPKLGTYSRLVTVTTYTLVVSSMFAHIVMTTIT